MEGYSQLKSESNLNENYQPSVEQSYYKTDDEQLNKFVMNQQKMLQQRDYCLKFVVVEIFSLFALLVIQVFVWQEHTDFDHWYFQVQGVWIIIVFLLEFYGVHTLYYLFYQRLRRYKILSIFFHVVLFANQVVFLAEFSKARDWKHFQWIIYVESILTAVIALTFTLLVVYAIKIEKFYLKKGKLTIVQAGSRDHLNAMQAGSVMKESEYEDDTSQPSNLKPPQQQRNSIQNY